MNGPIHPQRGIPKLYKGWGTATLAHWRSSWVPWQ